MLLKCFYFLEEIDLHFKTAEKVTLNLKETKTFENVRVAEEGKPLTDNAEKAKASFTLVFTKQINCELVSDTINAEELDIRLGRDRRVSSVLS